MIEVRGVHKSFGANHVLRGVDLVIPTGECMVILGRSGSGKSVLLKCIIGLLRPDAGSVLVDGVDVTTLDYDGLGELRRRFGMLFQMAALFDSMSVGENVGLALRERRQVARPEIDRIVADKLRRVGLPGTEALRPASLSGGMRKRVGLARAIAEEPDYVLYDEPTTGLDPITAMQINILIRNLQQTLNITSVVVTHDMVSANHVGDRMVLLHEGKLIFQGTPQEMHRTNDPAVRQFLRGEAYGPLTKFRPDSADGPVVPTQETP